MQYYCSKRRGCPRQIANYLAIMNISLEDYIILYINDITLAQALHTHIAHEKLCRDYFYIVAPVMNDNKIHINILTAGQNIVCIPDKEDSPLFSADLQIFRNFPGNSQQDIPVLRCKECHDDTAIICFPDNNLISDDQEPVPEKLSIYPIDYDFLVNKIYQKNIDHHLIIVKYRNTSVGMIQINNKYRQRTEDYLLLLDELLNIKLAEPWLKSLDDSVRIKSIFFPLKQEYLCHPILLTNNIRYQEVYTVHLLIMNGIDWDIEIITKELNSSIDCLLENYQKSNYTTGRDKLKFRISSIIVDENKIKIIRDPYKDLTTNTIKEPLATLNKMSKKFYWVQKITDFLDRARQITIEEINNY